MIIYLIRHAEYKGIEGGSHAQNLQAGLTPLGRLQARALAGFLKKRKVSRVFSSELTRSRETAEIISKTLGLSYLSDPRLNEFVASLNETDGARIKEYKARAREDHCFASPDGESMVQALARFSKFWEEAAPSFSGGTVVVSHALILEGFLKRYFGLTEAPHLKTASVTAIEFRRGARLLFVGRRIWSWPLLVENAKRRLLTFRGY